MKQIKVLLATILVSIGVALTYFYFELAVRVSTVYVWDTLFDSSNMRWLVIPLCFVLTLVYFAAQHFLDHRAETHESEGLGDMPSPTVANYLKVLAIGFLSLLAGASLGPEAILVPACMILGAFAGKQLFKEETAAPKLLSLIGFVALFAAFFSSFVAGMLGLLLVMKKMGGKLTNDIIVLSALASAVVVAVLNLLESESYLSLPPQANSAGWMNTLALIGLAVVGYNLPFIIKYLHDGFAKVAKATTARHWLLRAFVASLGLAAIYLLGGPLVQFTGNESVVPMFDQAASLGILGLAWLAITKLLAISWSKAFGYRGGLIFPSVFVASTLVALAQTVVPGVHIAFGIIAVMIGMLAADSKVKILV